LIYLVLAALLWGSSFPVITYALRDTSPMLLLVLRFAIAFGVLSLWYRSWRDFKTIFRRDVFLISIPNALSFVLQFRAQELTTASKTALFVNSSPVFVAIMTGLVLRERLHPRQIVATMVAMTGVVITSTRLDFSTFSAVNLGDVLAIGVGLSWAIFMVYSRDVVKKYGPRELSHALYFWTILLALPLALAEPSRMSWSSAPAILYLAILTTALAYYLYLKGVRSVTPLATSLIILVEVVVAFVISHTLLAESFSPVETVGVVMVLGGVSMVLKR
jgi:drug/metabolite transporter (DMT)-like permease